MKKSLPFFMLLLSTSIVSFAQQHVMQKEVDKQGNVSFMVFDNKTSFISKESAKKLLHDSLKFRKDDDVVLKKEMKDELGFTHQFYDQQYKGIRVEYGLYSVHTRNGKIEYIDGEFKNVNNVDINPSLSEKEALQMALNYIHAAKYKWEDPNEEQFFKYYKNDSSATNFPKGELLIVKDYLKTNSTYRLAYKFDIYAIKPLSHKLYYVDAISGDILNSENLICDANTTGTAATRYSGSQSITGDSYSSPTRYRLRETRNGVRLETYNMQKGSTYSNTDFSDNDNNWSAAEYNNANFDNAALDSHWGLEKVCDYWYNVRNRISLNDNATNPTPLLNYVHANLTDMGYSNNDNAFWDGNCMTYGDGTNMNPFTALDVVAHETGHGLTQYACNLGHSGEPGALNEGFSDIWGAIIEHWAAPNDANKNMWLMGEQIKKDGTYLRSLSNPKANGYPDTYQGMYWDNGGEVHKNSTVLSHWFYLLSQGGSSWNDRYSYYVNGVGLDAAAAIVYRAETYNLVSHPDATYNSAMTYIIQAANDLYPNSMTAMQVKNAFYAVGLGTKPTQAYLSGPQTICTSGSTYTLNNAPTGYTISWSSSSNISLQVNSSTNTATASLNGTQSAWIQITYTSSTETIVSPKYPIWIGTPLLGSFTGPSSCMVGASTTHYTTVTDVYSSPTSYTWNLIPWVGNNYFNPGGQNCYVTWYTAGNYALSVSVNNICGSSSPYYFPVWVGSGRYLSVSPNPVSDNVQVSIKNTQSTALTADADAVSASPTLTSTSQDVTTSYSVRIYNSFGTLLYTSKKSGDSFTVPVNNLKDGTYIIEANDGKQSYKQQLIVKH